MHWVATCTFALTPFLMFKSTSFSSFHSLKTFLFKCVLVNVRAFFYFSTLAFLIFMWLFFSCFMTFASGLKIALFRGRNISSHKSKRVLTLFWVNFFLSNIGIKYRLKWILKAFLASRDYQTEIEFSFRVSYG